MVLITLTPAARAAIEKYRQTVQAPASQTTQKLDDLSQAAAKGYIEHHQLVDLSRRLLEETRRGNENGKDSWRLEALLKGAAVYRAPPPPKPEPTPEFKALMQRLREQEEQRQYDRMLNPPAVPESFDQRLPNTRSKFNPATSHGQTPDDADEFTYADVNRQVVLIFNVLISIIFSGVTIWFAARRWNIPERLGLSMSGGFLVAAAEIVIYMGYIRRIKEAKDKEVKTSEQKEIVETWVFDKPTASAAEVSGSKDIRQRKGKLR